MIFREYFEHGNCVPHSGHGTKSECDRWLLRGMWTWYSDDGIWSDDSTSGSSSSTFELSQLLEQLATGWLLFISVSNCVDVILWSYLINSHTIQTQIKNTIVTNPIKAIFQTPRLYNTIYITYYTTYILKHYTMYDVFKGLLHGFLFF